MGEESELLLYFGSASAAVIAILMLNELRYILWVRSQFKIEQAIQDMFKE
jgi:hypothetical protein